MVLKLFNKLGELSKRLAFFSFLICVTLSLQPVFRREEDVKQSPQDTSF